MVSDPVGLDTKNHCTGDDQQQFTGLEVWGQGVFAFIFPHNINIKLSLQDIYHPIIYIA
jgi:hypothetical protein